jgi:hypothetical protein
MDPMEEVIKIDRNNEQMKGKRYYEDARHCMERFICINLLASA